MEKPKNRMHPLLELFIRRVEEELKDKGLSRNALCRRVGAPPQTTFNEVMNGADPRLKTIGQIADALGVQAAELLMHKPAKAARVSGDTVVALPDPPKIIIRTKKRISLHDKTKRRA